jgi:SAM-dependent methyltransferase
VSRVSSEPGPEAVGAFYDALAEDYHLLFADWRASVARQGEVLDRVLRETLGDHPLRVLDAACGIGTQAIGVALKGHHVHGTDLSPGAVQRAQREAQSLGAKLELGTADFRALDQAVQGPFDAVLVCDNALPHLRTDDELLQALRAMGRVLRPGGLLLGSTRDYDRLIVDRPSGTTAGLFTAPDGRRMVTQAWEWLDERTYRFHIFIVQDHGGQGGQWSTRHHESIYRAITRDELSALMHQAGLGDVRWRSPDETGFKQPIVTARAP